MRKAIDTWDGVLTEKLHIENNRINTYRLCKEPNRSHCENSKERT